MYRSHTEQSRNNGLGKTIKQKGILYGQVVVTHDLSIPARSQRLIRQFIYENGNQFAKAVFSGGGSGWWSPDSVGSYTYAN